MRTRTIPLLPLAELALGLRDLLTTRRRALGLSEAGKIYEPLLHQKLQEIERVQSRESFGAAIHHLATAYLLAPSTTPEQRVQLERIRDGFAPSLGELRRTDGDRRTATAARRSLGKLASSLQQFPLAGGETLALWAREFVSHSAQRAALSPRVRADRSITMVRRETVALLSRCRGAINDELRVRSEFAPPRGAAAGGAQGESIATSSSPSRGLLPPPALRAFAHTLPLREQLPRDLDAQVFGYFEELARARSEAARRRSPPRAAPAPVAPMLDPVDYLTERRHPPREPFDLHEPPYEPPEIYEPPELDCGPPELCDVEEQFALHRGASAGREQGNFEEPVLEPEPALEPPEQARPKPRSGTSEPN